MKLAAAFVLPVLFGLCTVAQATVMVPLAMPDLVHRADRIVLGTVESQSSHWTPDHDAIYTDVTLRVTRAYKGAVVPGQTLVVRRAGGSVDGIGMRVFGAPTFTTGEEAVLFVEHRGAASFVVGMSQGKLRVTTEPDGRKLVARSLADVAFTRAPTAAERTPRLLDDLERQIRGLVNK